MVIVLDAFKIKLGCATQSVLLAPDAKNDADVLNTSAMEFELGQNRLYDVWT